MRPEHRCQWTGRTHLFCDDQINTKRVVKKLAHPASRPYKQKRAIQASLHIRTRDAVVHARNQPLGPGNTFVHNEQAGQRVPASAQVRIAVNVLHVLVLVQGFKLHELGTGWGWESLQSQTCTASIAALEHEDASDLLMLQATRSPQERKTLFGEIIHGSRQVWNRLPHLRRQTCTLLWLCGTTRLPTMNRPFGQRWILTDFACSMRVHPLCVTE